MEGHRSKDYLKEYGYRCEKFMEDQPGGSFVVAS